MSKQETRTYNHKENNPIETDPEMTQMRELANKNVKTIIVKMLHTFKKAEGKKWLWLKKRKMKTNQKEIYKVEKYNI